MQRKEQLNCLKLLNYIHIYNIKYICFTTNFLLFFFFFSQVYILRPPSTFSIYVDSVIGQNITYLSHSMMKSIVSWKSLGWKYPWRSCGQNFCFPCYSTLVSRLGTPQFRKDNEPFGAGPEQDHEDDQRAGGLFLGKKG